MNVKVLAIVLATVCDEAPPWDPDLRLYKKLIFVNWRVFEENGRVGILQMASTFRIFSEQNIS